VVFDDLAAPAPARTSDVAPESGRAAAEHQRAVVGLIAAMGLLLTLVTEFVYCATFSGRA